MMRSLTSLIVSPTSHACQSATALGVCLRAMGEESGEESRNLAVVAIGVSVLLYEYW
jgi:hypothetical protein